MSDNTNDDRDNFQVLLDWIVGKPKMAHILAFMAASDLDNERIDKKERFVALQLLELFKDRRRSYTVGQYWNEVEASEGLETDSLKQEIEMGMMESTEIQRVHDILMSIVMGEVPPPPMEDGSLVVGVMASVLCWVLGHKHNNAFGEVMSEIEEYLNSEGWELHDMGKILKREVQVPDNYDIVYSVRHPSTPDIVHMSVPDYHSTLCGIPFPDNECSHQWRVDDDFNCATCDWKYNQGSRDKREE